MSLGFSFLSYKNTDVYNGDGRGAHENGPPLITVTIARLLRSLLLTPSFLPLL